MRGGVSYQENMWSGTYTQLSTIYIPKAKKVLSGSRLVQGKGNVVEIDSIGTRLVCNKGTRPTLHMSYDKDN
jgi:hypothetical protein